MTPLRLTVAVGTRPEVIKLAPVVERLVDAGHQVRCIATGQHSDPAMYSRLFQGFGLEPDATWVLSGTEGERVGSLLAHAFAELDSDRPDAVLVLGDTYTAPTVAMAARRFGIGVVHVEAGLRSFNERSMEECNRRMVAALATVHLAPTDLAASFLRDEGVPAERIRVVGNPVVDALRRSGVGPVDWAGRSGTLVTAHRATNVDDPYRLRELVEILRLLGRDHGPVTLPLHPRTRARLIEAGLLDDVLHAPGVLCTEPLPYEELLRCLASSRLVVTDSGGLQEEAAYFGVPVVVMRTTTPRWESVRNGAAVLTGVDAPRVRAAAELFSDPAEGARVAALPCPYGDGRTGDRVVAALADPELRRLLVPGEPALGTGPLASPVPA